MLTVIRFHPNMQRLELDQIGNRVRLYNRHGNLMFDGTIKLFHTCVDRGWFEVEGS